MSASAAHMSSCTRRISSCVSAEATSPAGTGGSTRIVMRLRQSKRPFRTDQALRAVEHHGKDVRTGLLRQREGPGLEAVNLAVLRTRALGEDGHGGSAGDPHAALAGATASIASAARPRSMQMSPCRKRNCPKKGTFIDLALGDPAEIERQVVKRRNVDHRIVVHDDDVGAGGGRSARAPRPAAARREARRRKIRTSTRERKCTTRRARSNGQQTTSATAESNMKKGAQQHQKQVIEGTQHNLGSERNAPHGAAFGGAGSRYTILINPSSKDSDFFRDS